MEDGSEVCEVGPRRFCIYRRSGCVFALLLTRPDPVPWRGFCNFSFISISVLFPCIVSCHLRFPCLRQRTSVKRNNFGFIDVPCATPIFTLQVHPSVFPSAISSLTPTRTAKTAPIQGPRFSLSHMWLRQLEKCLSFFPDFTCHHVLHGCY